MSASRSASERLGTLAACALAIMGGVAVAARAETPSVRVGAIELSPTGLLQVDGGDVFDRAGRDSQGAGMNARRARLGGIMTLDNVLKAGVIWDFGRPPGKQSSLYQADLAYAGPLPIVARAGVFKAPFTLEYAQGAGDTLFLERATINTLVVGLVAGGGRVGGQLGGAGDRWFASAFLTGGKTGSGARSEQRAVLGRVAGLVVKTDSVSVHLGASGAWLYQVARAGDGSRTLSLSDQPEIQLTQAPASLNSGAIPAHGARLGGIEAGLTWNRVWLQAEGYAITVEGSRGAGRSPTSSGGYMQASYTLLGAPRGWSPSLAAWGSPSPDGAWGAVEVGARFSYADLQGLVARGGRQIVSAVSLSWYPVKPLRFLAEYGHGRVEGGAMPRSLDFLAARAQLAF